MRGSRFVLQLSIRFKGVRQSTSPNSGTERPERALLHRCQRRVIFDAAYSRLKQSYRCEYVFKNEIIRKLFLARHDEATSIVVPELPVRGNRIDLVVINGTTTAYEIKTRYDSLDRLKAQIDASLLVFDRTIIVCDPGHVAKVRALILDERVGVICYTDAGTFRTERQWRSNAAQADPRAIFDCLRADEYVPALRRLLGTVPSVPNTMTYRTFAPLFASLQPRIAHAILANMLKRRFADNASASLARILPAGMAQIYYETPHRDRGRLFANRLLNRKLVSGGYE